MKATKIGVQLHPQDTTVDELRTAWKAADSLGADSIFLWDHFYPLYGDPDARHYECYTLLAAMAAETSHAQLGALVTCNSYRNPDLLADMSRTIDLISGGRFILGIGSGWFERDYDEYGYEFGTARGRLDALAEALPRIKARIARLTPSPTGPMPILIGGSGEKVTLRIVAEQGDMWNTFGPADHFAQKNAILNDHCAAVGRDPSEIERTIAINAGEIDDIPAFVEAGATHMILMMPPPFNMADLERALAHRS
ncbi:MAG: LLM class F420-dependent oxidoreductase [Acidimicrobiia bacterium]